MAEETPGGNTPEEKMSLHPPKVKLPHKFCPYCGYRNDASVDLCENCGKDISWMRVPEPRPPTETPYKAPKPLPKQRELSRRMIFFIFLGIGLLIVIALIVALIATGKSKGAEVTLLGLPCAAAMAAHVSASAVGRHERTRRGRRHTR